ncbi:MAG: osmoprotectant transport system substrate-binding protein [Actinomycetota bacterium]|nr:osmoprotectant transport system substrate-binding protein [Actinomycetota bacterium]
MRRSRKLVLGATALALLMVLGACGSGEDGTGDTGGSDVVREDVTVGVSGAFAENQIVAEMYAQVLENAGYKVDRQLDLGSREISEPALDNGEIDIKPEYLGSLLLFLDPEAAASGDPQNNADLLEPLLAENSLSLLEPSGANDTNSFVVTQETADEFGLASMSDLADVAGDLTLGGPPECPDRPFCIPGLEKTYGATFGDFKALDVGGPLTVAALDEGKIDVGLLFSTSSVIGAKGWVVLEDDQSLQTAENITPVVRDDLLNDEITELLNAVSAELTSEIMIELNGRVELDKEDPADVATDFLTEAGLL